MTQENFIQCCYDLYRFDWIKNKVTDDMIRNMIRKYHEDTDGSDLTDYSLANYIEELGFGGHLYEDINEFLQNEFMDADYMGYLLNDTGLWKEYLSAAKCMDAKGTDDAQNIG